MAELFTSLAWFDKRVSMYTSSAIIHQDAIYDTDVSAVGNLLTSCLLDAGSMPAPVRSGDQAARTQAPWRGWT
jgi:hypothetical protein